MRRRFVVMVVAASLATAVATTAAASAVVRATHDLALQVARAAGLPSPAQADALAIVDLAMFDAANGIERRFRPHRLHAADPPPGLDASAAALGAGCGALAAWIPAQAAAASTACATLAATLGDAEAVRAGFAFGQASGRALAAAHRAELRAVASPYRPATAPGVYVPTTMPVGLESAVSTPLALRSPAQWRPGPPPSLQDARWTRDYEEVRSLGGRASVWRTAAQSDTAVFWSSSGPQQYLDSIAGLPLRETASAAEHARLLALLTMAVSDVGIAVFDAKYHYNFWRPVTAIRNGDLDGNDATERDAGWTPWVDTPPHPEYPCAHCATGAAIAEVLEAARADGLLAGPVVIRPAAAAAGMAARSWTDAREFPAEVADARVWGGVHFRTSTTTGIALGVAVARWILDTQLVPLDRGG